METYNVQFLQEALDDLEEIILYIAQDSRASALSFHDKIIDRLNGLSTFPKMGRLIPDKKMADAGYRVLSIKPYLAFYRIIGETIFIYRILHGAMNYPLLYQQISEI